MTYNNAVKYINSLPTVSSGNSDRLRNVCAALGSPHKHLRSIQICGNAGKTSCCEMLSSILSQSGYGTGCYSLPHTGEPRERITADGKAIPHAEFAEYVKRISSLPQEILGESPLSQSEILILVAILYFSDMERDAVIFESPLSRYDALLDPPILSVVSSIFDSTVPVSFSIKMAEGDERARSAAPAAVVSTRSAQSAQRNRFIIVLPNSVW